MGEPDIFKTADRFRREMLRRERAASTELVRYYGEIWKRIRSEITKLTRRYYDAVAAGEAVSPAWLYQLERLQHLQRQVEAEVRSFARFAETKIQTEQWEAVRAARQHTQVLTQVALGDAAERLGFSTELTAVWSRLPDTAVADLIGFLEDGSPLSELLSSLGPSASKAVGQELVSGLGLGLSPREVAKRIRKEFGGDLVRALRVARTETMRAYREATRRAYHANGDIVGTWTWHSGLDARTCAACWAMHGTVHPLFERLDDHPNGRCSMLPNTKSWQELGREFGIDLRGVPETRIPTQRGSDLFAKLSPDRQTQILGPSKFAAYRAGEFELGDLVGRRQSKRWGSHRYERSLKDVLGAERARRYRDLTRPAGPKSMWRRLTPSEMDEWGERQAATWMGSTTQAQREAITRYTGEAHGPVNDLLRKGAYDSERFPDSSTTHLVQSLDSILERSRLDEDLVLYRSFGERALYRQLQVGDAFDDLGFGSTSLSRARAARFLPKQRYPILAEIRAPKGAPAAYIAGLSWAPGQQEVVLARGRWFRIHAAEYREIKGRRVRLMILELLPGEPGRG